MLDVFNQALKTAEANAARRSAQQEIQELYRDFGRRIEERKKERPDEVVKRTFPSSFFYITAVGYAVQRPFPSHESSEPHELEVFLGYTKKPSLLRAIFDGIRPIQTYQIYFHKQNGILVNVVTKDNHSEILTEQGLILHDDGSFFALTRIELAEVDPLGDQQSLQLLRDAADYL